MSQRVCNSKSEMYWNEEGFNAKRMTIEDIPLGFASRSKSISNSLAKKRRLKKTAARDSRKLSRHFKIKVRSISKYSIQKTRKKEDKKLSE